VKERRKAGHRKESLADDSPGPRSQQFASGFRISLVSCVSLGLFLLASSLGGVELFALWAVLSGALVVLPLVWLWPASEWRGAQRAALSGGVIMALIWLFAWRLPAAGVATLLCLPVINAMLHMRRPGLLLFAAGGALSWLLLRRGLAVPDLPGLLNGLAELLPFMLAILLISRQQRHLGAASQQIASLAAQDQLTGVLEKSAFIRRVQRLHLQAETAQQPYAVLMIDIAGLQAINEEFGHDEGDRVLQAVAEATQRSTRRDDLVARFGGDEFVVALPGADDAVAQNVANRISQNVYNINLSFERKMRRVEVNSGIAIFPDSGESVQDLMQFADQAMYRDKAFRKRVTTDEPSAAESRRQAGLE